MRLRAAAAAPITRNMGGSTLRRRVALVLTFAVAVLGVVAAPATSASLRVKVTGTTSKPKVGQRYTLTVSARKGRKAAKGTVRVDVLMNGQVVRTIANNERLRGGKWRITQKVPSIAKGQKITFRGTVTSGKQRASGTFTVRFRG